MKWHYPVGLLFDLYAGIDPATKNSAGNEDSHEEDASYPWRLTVHFSDWPVEDLVRLDPGGLVMNDAFINSVKEADFLRNGTAKGIMSLSKEDSSGLWKAVENGEHSYKRKNHSILITELTEFMNSRSPLVPTHLKQPPPTTITTIPQRPNPYLPATTTGRGLPVFESRPVTTPPIRTSIQYAVQPSDQYTLESSHATTDYWRCLAHAAPQSIPESKNARSCKARAAWCCASYVGPD